MKYPEPVTKDESTLVGLMFEKITELYPDWPMGDRTDLAMALFAVVKQWGSDEELVSDSAVMVEANLNEDYELEYYAQNWDYKPKPVPGAVLDTDIQ